MAQESRMSRGAPASEPRVDVWRQKVAKRPIPRLNNEQVQLKKAVGRKAMRNVQKESHNSRRRTSANI